MPFAPKQEHPRYRASLHVDVVAANGDVEAMRLENISLGGLFLRTPAPLPPSSFVRVRLPIDEADAPVSIMARVVHALPEHAARAQGRPAGMGVQFDGLAPKAELLLRRFLAVLADGERRTLDVEQVRAPLRDVLAAADHLVDRIAHLDGFAAIGLQPDADVDDVARATNRLLRLFSGAFAHASPEQRARIEAAAAALRALEAELLVRAS